MQFKKSILLTTFISLISVSIISNASLHTINYTNEDSTVKITSGLKHPCSSSAGKITPKKNSNGAPGESDASDNEIALLCITSTKDLCTAEIYNSNNCNGSGDVIGTASLNLKTKSVIEIKSINPSKYVFISENNGTKLTIKYPT